MSILDLPLPKPSKPIDERWHEFGIYTAMELTETLMPGKGKANEFRRCRCACGQVREIHYLALEEGRATSCGCERRPSGHPFQDITGQLFGKWLVLRHVANNCHGHTCWQCRCLGCEREYNVESIHLRSGGSTQCKHCARQKPLSRRWYNQQFHTGKAQVVESADLYSEMICICGRPPKMVKTSAIRNGESRSCMCRSTRRMPGEYFGFLYVLEPGATKYSQRKHSRRMWRCQCVCRYIFEVSHTDLIQGKSKSCGCRGKVCPLGTVYGQLTVIATAGRGHWTCQCRCGREMVVEGNRLRSGAKRNCGQCPQRISGFVEAIPCSS